MKQKEKASELTRHGVVFTPRGFDGVSVAVGGRPARLAVVSDDGEVVALGQEVEEQYADASVVSYQMMLRCEGLLRSVLLDSENEVAGGSSPILPARASRQAGA